MHSSPLAIRVSGAALAAATLLGTVAACGGQSATPVQVSAQRQAAGVTLDQPYTLPNLALTDTAGKHYDVAKKARGKVTLLFFGYTHCPDICPATLADLATTMRKLGTQSSHVQVVFVTADPRRDTPKVLRAFLNHFNHSFIGLTGSYATIKKLAAASHATVDAPAHPKPGTNYTVMHSAEVYVYGPDARAHLLFTANTQPDAMTMALRPVIKNAAAQKDAA